MRQVFLEIKAVRIVNERESFTVKETTSDPEITLMLTNFTRQW